MNLTLKHTDFLAEGIFGNLYDEQNRQLWATLEHSYDSGHGNGSYTNKIPPGVYKCVRGQHRLHSMTHTFETFEVTNVPGHTNILIHSGNKNDDSSGCVLLGTKRVNGTVVSSKLAFQSFMELQHGIDQFTLTVI